MIGIIYKYTGPTGKVYIGQTIHPVNRRAQHKRAETDSYFHRAIRKYGYDAFKYEIIVKISSPTKEQLHKELDKAEMFYIKVYDTFKNGYNQSLGGDGPKGREPWNKGVPQTEEQKEKQRKAMTGRKASEETKAKMSVARTGLKRTDETKKNISAALKGKEKKKNFYLTPEGKIVQMIPANAKRWHPEYKKVEYGQN